MNDTDGFEMLQFILKLTDLLRFGGPASFTPFAPHLQTHTPHPPSPTFLSPLSIKPNFSRNNTVSGSGMKQLCATLGARRSAVRTADGCGAVGRAVRILVRAGWQMRLVHES